MKKIRFKIKSYQQDLEQSTIGRVVAHGMRYIRTQGWIAKEADKILGLVLMIQEKYRSLLESQVSEGVFSELPELTSLCV